MTRTHKLCLFLSNLVVLVPCALARNWADWAFLMASALSSMAYHATETRHGGPPLVRVTPQRQWQLLQLDRISCHAAVLWFASWPLVSENWIVVTLTLLCGLVSENVTRLPDRVMQQETRERLHAWFHTPWHVSGLGYLASLAVLSQAPRWWQF